MSDIEKELGEARAEWEAAQQAADEANARKTAAKARVSKAINAHAALQRLSPAEKEALGLSMVDGQLVQELPD